MDQVLQPMRRHVQRNDVTGVLLAAGLLQTLPLQDAVDFALDLIELGLPAADADAPAEGIKRIQRLLPGERRASPQKLPGRGEHRGERARDHWRQEDDVPPFVEEAFLRAVVEGG